MQNYADKYILTSVVNISSHREMEDKNASQKPCTIFQIGVWSVTKSVSCKKNDKQRQLNKNLHSPLLPLQLGGVWSPVRIWSSRHHLKPAMARYSAVITLHWVITFRLAFKSEYGVHIPQIHQHTAQHLWAYSRMSALGVWSVV